MLQTWKIPRFGAGDEDRVTKLPDKAGQPLLRCLLVGHIGCVVQGCPALFQESVGAIILPQNLREFDEWLTF